MEFCRGYYCGFFFPCRVSDARAIDSSLPWTRKQESGEDPWLWIREIESSQGRECARLYAQAPGNLLNLTEGPLISLTDIQDTWRTVGMPDHRRQLRKLCAMLDPQEGIHVWYYKPRQRPPSWEDICPIRKAIAFVWLNEHDVPLVKLPSK